MSSPVLMFARLEAVSCSTTSSREWAHSAATQARAREFCVVGFARVCMRVRLLMKAVQGSTITGGFAYTVNCELDACTHGQHGPPVPRRAAARPAMVVVHAYWNHAWPGEN